MRVISAAAEAMRDGLSQRSRKSIPVGWLPDTPQEHQPVGDLSDAMFQEMKHQITDEIVKDRT